MDGFNFDNFMGMVQNAKMGKKYPNFSKYPQLIRDCLEINERLQAIGNK